MQPAFSWSMWGSTAWMVFRAPPGFTPLIAIPLGICDILKLDLPRNAGVVHQQAHGTQLRFRSANHRLHSRPVRHIRLNCNGISTMVPDFFCQRLSLLPVRQVIDTDSMSILRQLRRNALRSEEAPVTNATRFIVILLSCSAVKGTTKKKKTGSAQEKSTKGAFSILYVPFWTIKLSCQSTCLILRGHRFESCIVHHRKFRLLLKAELFANFFTIFMRVM